MKSAFRFPLQSVLPEWIDYNGHMNVAYYVLVFDHCVDALLNQLKIGPAQMEKTGCSTFVLESHINYIQEVVENDPLRVEAYLLDYDKKRIHYYMEMYHAEKKQLVAATEQLAIRVNLEQRRTTVIPNHSMAIIEKIVSTQAKLPEQHYTGRKISIS